jgi:hypothetical protein
MAHTPLGMTTAEVQTEIRYAWLHSYSAAATAHAIESIADEPVPYKISHLVARIFFRGIYFPPKGIWGWLKVVTQNRGSIFRIVKESFTKWGGAPGNNSPRLELDLEDSQTSVGSKPEATELTVT